MTGNGTTTAAYMDNVRVMTGFAESLERFAYSLAPWIGDPPSDGLLAAESELVASGVALAAQFEALGMEVADFEVRMVRVTPKDRRHRAAHHGAGHLVAAHVLGVAVANASLDCPTSPADDVIELGLGPSLLLSHPPPGDEATRARLEPEALRLAVVLLAGTAGELLADPHSSPAGSGSDIREARRLCSHFTRPGRSEHEFATAVRRAALLARSAEAAVRALAASLLRHGTVTGEAVAEIVVRELGARADLLARNFSGSVVAEAGLP